MFPCLPGSWTTVTEHQAERGGSSEELTHLLTGCFTAAKVFSLSLLTSLPMRWNCSLPTFHTLSAASHGKCKTTFYIEQLVRNCQSQQAKDAWLARTLPHRFGSVTKQYRAPRLESTEIQSQTEWSLEAVPSVKPKSSFSFPQKHPTLQESPQSGV